MHKPLSSCRVYWLTACGRTCAKRERNKKPQPPPPPWQSKKKKRRRGKKPLLSPGASRQVPSQATGETCCRGQVTLVRTCILYFFLGQELPCFAATHIPAPYAAIAPGVSHQRQQLRDSSFAVSGFDSLPSPYSPIMPSFATGSFVVLVGFLLINAARQLLFRTKTEPPAVFHWIPYIGNAVSYGKDPVDFFEKCRAKVCLCFLCAGTP